MGNLFRPFLISLFFLIFSIFYSALQFYYLYHQDLESDFSLIFYSPIVFDIIVSEFILLSIFIISISNGSRLSRIISLIVLTIIILVENFQFLSLFFSGDFINPDIMDNAELIGYLVSPFTVSVMFIPLFLLVGGFYFYQSRFELTSLRGSERWTGSIVFFILLCIFLAANNNALWFYKIKDNYKAGYESPIYKMAEAFAHAHHRNTTKPRFVSLSDKDIEIASQYGLKYQKDQKYPFRKHTVYEYKNTVTATPSANVIVFFVESLSARLNGVYRKDFAHLTPNMIDFSNSSLVVKKYYNHVTPTIVGLRGQLCSIFPHRLHTDWRHDKIAKKIVPIRCLPHVLDDQGYDTYYFGYSHPGATYFENQMQASGFKNTYFFQDFLNHFVGKDQRPERGRHGNSDRQMFTGLINFLDTRKSKQPFFVALSTVDTHPMSALLDYQKKYPGEKNRKKNLIYNTDMSFGKFWSYFKKSPYKDNTIVILTADHAHTASVLLDEVADASYRKENFDEMTLVIHAPKNHLPSEMTVYGSSLDFAPSLLNLLGINHVENSFMGRSIFGDRQKTKGAVGLMYNRKLFLVNKNKYMAKKLSLSVCDKDNLDPDTQYMCSVFKVIKQSHYLQVEDRF